MVAYFLQDDNNTLTTFIVITGFGKLGFFFAFLMFSVLTLLPPHSTSTRGEVTCNNRNLLISLTPQHNIYRTQMNREMITLLVQCVCVCVLCRTVSENYLYDLFLCIHHTICARILYCTCCIHNYCKLRNTKINY